MKKVIKFAVYWAGILTIGIIVGVTAKIVEAWVEPSQAPPGGNIVAPLNASNIGQAKQGGLTLNIGGAIYGLLVDKGLVGIGTTAPGEKLEVNGNIKLSGNAPTNKIMNVAYPTSDSDVATKGYVDVAMAATLGQGVFPREIEGVDNQASSLAEAAKNCRDKGSDWALPTFENSSLFIGISGASAKNILTRSPVPRTVGKYYVINLTDGTWEEESPTGEGAYYFRCVRY